jgi:flagellar protein FliO/FliZ
MGSTTKVVVNLTIFIIIIFVFAYLYKKYILSNKLFKKRSRYVEQVDKYFLSNDKWIEIIKIGDKILLLGVANNSINEIREISQEDLHELNFEQDENVFKTVLSKYTKKQN